MDKEETFKSIDSNGKEITNRIILTFYNNKTKKDYIVYTDDTLSENGSLNIYAAIFYPAEPNRNFEAIETDEEWDEIEKLLKELSE